MAENVEEQQASQNEKPKEPEEEKKIRRKMLSLDHNKLFYKEEGMFSLIKAAQGLVLDVNKSPAYNFKKIVNLFKAWHNKCFPVDDFENFCYKIFTLVKEDRTLGNVERVRQIVLGNATWHSMYPEHFERTAEDDRMEKAELESAEKLISEVREEDWGDVGDELLDDQYNKEIGDVLKDFEAVMNGEDTGKVRKTATKKTLEDD